jgi:hypothetical protein
MKKSLSPIPSGRNPMPKYRLLVNQFYHEVENVKSELENYEWVDELHTFDLRDKKSLLHVSSIREISQSVISYAYDGIVDDKVLYNKLLNRVFYRYCYMMFRRSFYDDLSIYDLTTNFRIHFLFFLKFLTDKKIDIYLSSPGFSEGFDLLIYEICKELGVKTLFIENYFYGHFFVTNSLDDWGNFNNTPELFDEKRLTVPEVNPLPPFYHKPTQFKVTVPPIKSFLPHPFKTFSKNGLLYLSRKIKWLHYNLFMMRRYKKNESEKPAKFDFDNIDFVLFTLHVQPEASTLAFAGEYEDQLLAIERCSKLIPVDWKILVKEHPGQISMEMRNETFYRRLNSIPKVEFIHPFANIVELIKKSKFVCTLTGTASWEAVRLKVPSLVFGKSTFLFLPGVRHIDSISSYKEIVNQKWSLDDIEKALVKMTHKMGRGFVNIDYFDATDVFNNFSKTDVDLHKNGKITANSINTIIKNISRFK